MPYDEQKLRERAYEFWMQDGCKEGRSDHYWFQAEREIRSKGDECAELARTLPQPSSHAPRAPKGIATGTKSKAGQKSSMGSRSMQARQHVPG
jgi:hypothetical protein